MNKIYKVIWSKVKHQYVVVSELAHSNGKQSRTSKSSIRSRIAALVVCGAIAAFGVFNTLPNSAFAAENYEYIAFQDNGTLGNEDSDTIKLGPKEEYTYVRTEVIDPTKKEGEDGRIQTFWVREGFNIELVENVRFDQNNIQNAKTDTVIVSHKNPGANEEGLILSYQNVDNDMHVKTLNGDNLYSAETGMYGGGVNTHATPVTTTSHFVLRKKDGSYVDIKTSPNEGSFVTLDDNKGLIYNSENNTYYFKGKAVAKDNMYVLTENNEKKTGVFTLNGELYTDDVYGRNNEILMTGVNSQNKLDSYWGTEIDDPEMSISQMTMGQLDERFDAIKKDIVDVHRDNINKINVNKNNNGNGGTIGLQTNGSFDEEGNPVGDGEMIPGGITITSEATTGKDTKIRFANEANPDGFTVDAGSKVVGKITTENGVQQEAGVNDANKTLTGLKINGVDYALSQGKTYDKGDGINIDENTNKISVALAEGQDKENASGLHFKDGKLVNDLQVKSYETPTSTTNKDGGNWTITKTDENGESVNLTNTTLDTNASSVYNYNESKDNLIKGDKDTSYENTEYGRNYKVIDTDGNEVELKDVASADTLKTIDTTKIGDLKYNDFTEGDSDTTSIVKNDDNLTTAVGKLDNAVNETKTLAGKHTKMTVNDGTLATTDGEYNSDGNLQLKQTVENDQTTYDVKLNDNITLGEGNNQININGAPEDDEEAALSIGNKFIVGQDGSIQSTVKTGTVTEKVSTFNFDKDGVNIKSAVNGKETSTLINGGTVIIKDSDADYTLIKGEKITAGDIKLNAQEGKSTILGLTNTEWNDTVKESVKDNTSKEATVAATQGQLLDATELAVQYDNSDKDSIILGGSETYTVGTEEEKPNGGVKLTNVAYATGEDKSEAVNVEYLEDTVDSINEASYKGWTVTTNGGKIEADKAEVASNGNVDFSNTDGNIIVGQNGTNLTFDLNDNIILGKGNNQININATGTDEENSSGKIVIGQGNKTVEINSSSITLNKSLVIDGSGVNGAIIHGLSNNNWDPKEKDNSTTAATEGQLYDVYDSAVKYDNSDNKATITLEGSEYNGKQGGGTRLTNVAYATGEDGSEAVNVNYLEDTVDSINNSAYKGWTVSANGDNKVAVPSNGNVDFSNNDGNIVVGQDSTNLTFDLNDNITLGKGNNQININATGTDEENSSGKIVIGQGNKTVEINSSSITLNKSLVIDGSGVNGAIIHGLSNNNWDPKEKDNSTTAATEGQLYDVYDGSVKYWKKQDGTYDKSFIQLEGGEKGTTITHLKDGVVAEHSTEAINGSQLWETQQQIKDVETTASKHTIVSTPEDSNLTVKNVAEKGEADNYQVTLNDDIILGDYFNNGDGVLISGKSGTISATNSITVGEDQGLVIDGQKKTVQGLSNTTWTGTTETPNRAATEGQLQSAYDGSVKYWKKQDGTYDKSFIQLEGGEKGTTITHLKDGVVAEHSTEAINGSQLWETQQQIKDVETTASKHTIVSTPEDSNLTVKNVAEKGEAANYQVALKDDITLKGDSSSIELTGTKGTIQVNQETAEGTNFTNINGNVVSIGYTNSEGIENAIVIDGGKGTITGLSNTTWDDELAKQVADSEELQGTAATQGQLQQAVSEVSGIVNKGWTAKAGDNDGEINITPGDTLNFEGDGNILVNATSNSNELKFGLNHNIKLDNIDNEKTMMIFNTDGKNADGISGYIPGNYKDDEGNLNDFVKTHGGFAIYYANPDPNSETHDMTGTFGVTTDGMVHAKDVIVYTTSSDPTISDTVNYSLKEVGDLVSQMATYYTKDKNDNLEHAYTVFSHYLSEEDKDNPFEVVEEYDENGKPIETTKERAIPLALRDDGAVLIGAVADSDGLDDSGIRINAETDSDGNNKATITGLENTEWKPTAPQSKIATFAETTTTETSRAATEAQLDDLYNVVSVYNTFDNNGNVNYNTIKLRGDEYSYNKENPVDSKGTVITNVAYSDGTGSDAVNVDYLNDAIAGVKTEASGSDKYLSAGAYDQESGKITLTVANSQDVVIDGIASKDDITKIDNKIDNTFNDLKDKIKDINTAETDVKGGSINEDGTISLKTENDDGTTTDITLNGNLTDSGVIQDGTSFDGETGTLTITSQDKYSKETSSVTVSGIASKDDIGAVTDTIGVTSSEDLKDAYKDADKDGNATTAYITESESMVEADVALDHAIQDVANTGYANDMVLSNRIDSVEKRLGNVEERIDKVGAMAAAIANLRTMGFDPEAPTEIAIGVGQYKSETGIAIGVFHYPNQDFMLSASLSSSGDELMGGIGATWKLGRKSAAERAKDEEARHLEQAEEMKKLAQQEKVKAQAQRHAKLLAERQQASQKNA